MSEAKFTRIEHAQRVVTTAEDVRKAEWRHERAVQELNDARGAHGRRQRKRGLLDRQ